MKEEWLMSGALIPVDRETTAALVAEIKRLIDVVGGLVLKQGPDYERGRPWVGLTEKEAQDAHSYAAKNCPSHDSVQCFADAIQAKLKEKNNG